MTDGKVPPMPEWPDAVDPNSDVFTESPDAAWLLYERARAEAALARLRVAVEALQYARLHMADASKYPIEAATVHARVFNALHAIGELPK